MGCFKTEFWHACLHILRPEWAEFVTRGMCWQILVKRAPPRSSAEKVAQYILEAVNLPS